MRPDIQPQSRRQTYVQREQLTRMETNDRLRITTPPPIETVRTQPFFDDWPSLTIQKGSNTLQVAQLQIKGPFVKFLTTPEGVYSREMNRAL